MKAPISFSETTWGVGFPVTSRFADLANGKKNWRNIALDAGIWAGSAFTLGGSRNPRLGQWLPPAVVDDLAKALAQAAEPGIRDIVKEERSKISKAFLDALPFAGASVTVLLATYFLAPDDSRTLKFAGYAGGWLLFIVGLGRSLYALSQKEPA